MEAQRFWLVFLLSCTSLATVVPAESEGGLVVTILSQHNLHHNRQAREKRRLWTEELRNTWNINDTVVVLSHELSDHQGLWTMAPLFPLLSSGYKSATWFLFVTEDTAIHFERLWEVLKKYDHSKELFLGHSLRDLGRTILHHYISGDGERAVLYPNLHSGWVLSHAALHKLVEHIGHFAPDFNIDPSFELAVFMRYLSTPDLGYFFPEPPPPSRRGILLTHVLEFCAEKEKGCATYYSQDLPNCGSLVELQAVFFAVKTCEKFHAKRLPVVQQTWGHVAEGSIAYYSEVADPVYQTTNIGVPNTESGHCGKTFSIIHKFHSDPGLHRKQWLVIADDDTLLRSLYVFLVLQSVHRLCRLLACYDPHQPILLGEVYGYKAHHLQGTSYVTGGGGMVLSRAAVRAIVETSQRCPSSDYPDDMHLGLVARQLDFDIVHSPLFHQTQPESYHPTILQLQTSVSFHRHSPQDPYTVYRDYLTDGLREKGAEPDRQPWSMRNEL